MLRIKELQQVTGTVVQQVLPVTAPASLIKVLAWIPATLLLISYCWCAWGESRGWSWGLGPCCSSSRPGLSSLTPGFSLTRTWLWHLWEWASGRKSCLFPSFSVSLSVILPFRQIKRPLNWSKDTHICASEYGRKSPGKWKVSVRTVKLGRVDQTTGSTVSVYSL